MKARQVICWVMGESCKIKHDVINVRRGDRSDRKLDIIEGMKRGDRSDGKMDIIGVK